MMPRSLEIAKAICPSRTMVDSITATLLHQDPVTCSFCTKNATVLDSFATELVAKERERCARIADQGNGRDMVARAIRSGSAPPDFQTTLGIGAGETCPLCHKVIGPRERWDKDVCGPTIHSKCNRRGRRGS